MLILTRKPGQSLYIGGRIKITVMEIRGNQIRLGIEAPRDERIYREEIFVQIQDENRNAAVVDEGTLTGMEVPPSQGAPTWMSASASKGLAAKLSSGEAAKASDRRSGDTRAFDGKEQVRDVGVAPENAGSTVHSGPVSLKSLSVESVSVKRKRN